ncbi:carbohydrate ABC transporter permease [Paenibacillus piri]|uniref:Carbohydrate ABC transporter permease n=1 Tax=Paenibacillus piri TaxID=2547395 RepID=A0A4R5KWV5_9BACL|nr:carbohydrate ABC transporter permease [Paenibacillus piri]TDG00297.1 carbohydrate ABC transporter permease [Paenibacillus piri]
MKDTTGDKVFNLCSYIILLALGLSCLLPLVNTLALSLSDTSGIMSGKVTFWPVGFNWKAYDSLINGTSIIRSFGNSVLITVVGVLLSMTATIMAAYPLSKNHFVFRRAITLAVVFTMIFTGGMIPTYLVVKSLGLLNTYGALWFPALVSVYNMLILKTFFENIPVELEESAKIDGASEGRLLVTIVIPLAKPVLAALTLFYGVTFWNAFMSVTLYISDSTKTNLMVMVQQMVQNQQLMTQLGNLQPEDMTSMTPESIKSAAVIILVAPLLAVYPFVQKYFVKGVMIGAIKG